MNSIKTKFAVKSKYEAFYTGRNIELTKDGVYMFCGCGNKVNVLEISTGKVTQAVGQEDEEEISSFCLSPDNQYVVLATQHLLLKQWRWGERVLVRTWKAVHFAPVVSMAFDSTSTLLATGSADSTIKVWDIEKQYCTHNLRGHQGIISVVAFHPDISRLELYSAGEDYKVRVWSLTTSCCVATVDAHYSLVTCFVFSSDGASLYSCGRDGVVAVWDTANHAVVRTVPVYEAVESIVLLPESQDFPDIGVNGDNQHFITAGSKGMLRVWSAKTSQCVFSTDEVHARYQPESTEPAPQDGSQQNIVQMVYSETLRAIVVATYEHNISVISIDKMRLQKQFAGNNDEIVDIKYFGEKENYVVVATNSRNLKVFELSMWDCEIIYGHTDTVLSVDVYRHSNMFVSSGKDNTVRLWQLDPPKKQVRCLAMCRGHTHAVGAVACSRLKPTFFVSGSEDCTLKLWRVPGDLDPLLTHALHATKTERAHDKAINCVAVSPNDQYVASGSMDKTAKLWKATDLSLLGVMTGHKRGVWCVQFSPIDQILATSSGDGTIKLWTLQQLSCVKTFEGHDCAVLKVTFLTRGMQLLSCGTDGLVKLWTIKTMECVNTFDEHEDKLWALAANSEADGFITGGADSTLVLWQDVTESEQQEVRQKQEQFILGEQELSNLIQQKKYLKAIGLAITLEQPFRVLTIIKEILADGAGTTALCETLEKLRMDQIDAILRFACQWNTNSRHCHEAQFVLSSILQAYPATELRKFPNIKSSIEGLLPYTERHFARMTRLLQQSMFVEYAWQCMRSVTTDGSLLPSTSAAIETIHTDETSHTESIAMDMGIASGHSEGDSEGGSSADSEPEAERYTTTPRVRLFKKQLMDNNNNADDNTAGDRKAKKRKKKDSGVKKATATTMTGYTKVKKKRSVDGTKLTRNKISEMVMDKNIDIDKKKRKESKTNKLKKTKSKGLR